MSEQKKPHNRIAELRKEKGLTLQQVADAIGVGNNTISRYETGKREPKLETWIKLADFFNVPVSYLQGVGEYNYEDPQEIEKRTKHTLKELGFNIEDEDAANEIIMESADLSYKIRDNLLKNLNNYYNIFLKSKQSTLSDRQTRKLSKEFDRLSYFDQNILDFNLSMLFYLMLSKNDDKKSKQWVDAINKILNKFYKQNIKGK